MGTPLITFLTDYGRRDPFVGLCHAVQAAEAPHARVVDLTHCIAPQDVRHGAVILADCLPWPAIEWLGGATGVWELPVPAAAPALVGETFADAEPGQLTVLADAFGRLQLSVNQGDAGALLAARAGDVVHIRSGRW